LGGAGATLSDLLFGRIAGSMGETCKIAVLIGFVFLLQKKVISWHIPVCYVLSFAFFTSLTGENFAGIATSVCSGGLLFGAVFMATDYATSPKTDTGKMLYALSLGALTFFIRRFTAYNEGVVFSILIMNLVVPLIDQAVLPPRFGSGKKPVLSYSLYAITAAMAIALFILGLAKEGL
ncbi:MAG: RnfABCDGE type electron transport complex subunit D, partial [Clostridia bacterium]|nr:RnfABCDGE type electron transport complex subunit D [Clostridia bacterium]